MRGSDLLRISIRQLIRLRQRYRSAVIGTAVGTAALVIIISIGDSVEESISRNLELLGSTTLVKATIDYSEYTSKDIEDVRSLPGVFTAAPIVFGAAPEARHLNKGVLGVSLIGADDALFKALHLPVEEGRGISSDDARDAKSVCVIGKRLRERVFGTSSSPIGESIVLRGLLFQVVGILGETDEQMFNGGIIVPLTTARAKIPGMRRMSKIYVLPKSWNNAEEVYKEVGEVLRRNNPRYEHTITYSEDKVLHVKIIATTFKLFLYVAVGVTLVLGALGIANIMMALVIERTTEIGLRKAVGASDGDILAQFLFEALSVSVCSALIGIVVGSSVVIFVTMRVLKADLSYGAFALSLAAAMMLSLSAGVISGIIPARRAGSLDPVAAMRFE